MDRRDEGQLAKAGRRRDRPAALGVYPGRSVSPGRDRPLDIVGGLPVAPTLQTSQLRGSEWGLLWNISACGF